MFANFCEAWLNLKEQEEKQMHKFCMTMSAEFVGLKQRTKWEETKYFAMKFHLPN